MQGVSGKKLDDIYFAAWNAGLKTTYYLRTLGASQIEKASLDANKFGFTQKRIYKVMDSSSAQEVESEKQTDVVETQDDIVAGKACTISDDPACDVCQ
jgi:ribonucleoside-diphosphate reductase alpha chain